jgi:hypothetical protein
MTDRDADDRGLDEALGRGLQSAEPPPPAADLLAAVQHMKPVRTRSRFGAFLTVLGVGLIGPLASLLFRPMRADMGALPRVWLAAGAALWLGAFVSSLAAALIPRRDDVMPAAGRAARVAAAGMVVLFLFAALATAEAPGVSVETRAMGGLLGSCMHCWKFIFPIAGVFLLAGVFALRRVLPMGARRIGVALGAAGGAMAGFALHFQCPIAGAAHVVAAHVGGMALVAIVGGVVLPAVLER